MSNNWRVWDSEKEYGDLFYKRAIGELPEMESSKAIAKIISKLVKDNDLIIDVGCGAGHYLRSLDKKINFNFNYWGIDQTEYYIERAKEAFDLKVNENPKRIKTNFSVGEIYNLEMNDSSAEIVICNNVLLHLPSIEIPLSELIRISKKYIVIRMLLGKSSFRIKQVESPETYDENGEPINFHYYNIYSENYICQLLDKLVGVNSYSFQDDTDYNPSALGDATNYIDKKPDDLTTSINGIQLNVYILQPWKFVIIQKKH